MAGRKQKPETKKIKEVLENAESTYVINGKVVSDQILWKNLVIQHELNITPKNLYTRALLAYRQKQLSVVCEDISDLSDSSASSVTSLYEETAIGDSRNRRHFKIYIKSVDWDIIKPQLISSTSMTTNKPFKSRKRHYLSMKPGAWTDVFSREIWNVAKLPCTWKFTTQFVSMTENCLTVKAKCTECCSVLLCKVDNQNLNNLDGDGLFMNCTLDGDPAGSKHGSKKRKLAGYSRRIISKEMVENRIMPSTARKMLSAALTSPFDREPSIIPRLETLRKAKQELQNSNRLHSDPIKALEILAQTNPLQYIIHEIGIFKFFVHYWSPDQIRLYNAYCKKQNFPKICIDATGSVVRKLHRQNNDLSSHIQLYAVVISLPEEHEGQLCIAQMLSERQHSNSIHYWLSEWRRLGAKTPKEVICDFSTALISAICRAFAECSDMNTYIDKCVDVLTEQPGACLPSCFVRVDVAHLIKTVGRWKSIHPSNTRKRIRQFYLRGVGQLLLSTSFQEALSVLRDLFITALSETEGNNSKMEETECESVKKRLINRYAFGIQQSALKEMIEIEEDSTEENCTIENEIEDPSMKKLIDKVLQEARATVEQEIEGDRDNIMYLPQIIDPLKRLCYRLPLWSGIMVKRFGYGNITASSAPVEGYFNELKTRQFSSLPLRVDDFLINHVKFLEATVHLASGLKYFNDQKNVTDSEELNLFSATASNGHNTINNKEAIICTSNDKIYENRRICSTLTTCIACNNGDIPEGAHKCIYCSINVHALDGCSYGIEGDNDEGYGEKRICMPCMKNGRTKEHSFIQELNTIDNWKGLSAPPTNILEPPRSVKRRPKKNRASLYLNPQAEWAMVPEVSNPGKPVKISFLRNGGHISAPCTRKNQGNFLSLSNTCAFDVIVQSLAAAICDSRKFKEVIIDDNQAPFSLALHLAEQKPLGEAYNTRVQILSKCFNFSMAGGMMQRINCEATISDMIKKLNLISYKQTRSCPTCNTKENLFFHVIPTYHLNHDLRNIEDLILSNRPTVELCKTQKNGNPCATATESSIYYYDAIFVDVYLECNGVCLDEIPKVLNLSDKTFRLRAAVEFLKPSLPNTIGHYVAYCRRTDWSWEVFNDLLEKTKPAARNSIINLSMLIYTI